MVEEINGANTTAYHFHYDGNGNVTEVTDLTGNPAASYRYDAFGNTLVATGTYATQNRYRFSTKPLDSEVASAPLYYYGYRYYDPISGRWPSRDPIEEKGGVNLYEFIGNDGLNKNDKNGLFGIGPLITEVFFCPTVVGRGYGAKCTAFLCVVNGISPNFTGLPRDPYSFWRTKAIGYKGMIQGCLSGNLSLFLNGCDWVKDAYNNYY